MTSAIPLSCFCIWVTMLLSFVPLQFNETIGHPDDGGYGGYGGDEGKFVFIWSILSPSSTDVSLSKSDEYLIKQLPILFLLFN